MPRILRLMQRCETSRAIQQDAWPPSIYVSREHWSLHHMQPLERSFWRRITTANANGSTDKVNDAHTTFPFAYKYVLLCTTRCGPTSVSYGTKVSIIHEDDVSEVQMRIYDTTGHVWKSDRNSNIIKQTAPGLNTYTLNAAGVSPIHFVCTDTHDHTSIRLHRNELTLGSFVGHPGAVCEWDRE